LRNPSLGKRAAGLTTALLWQNVAVSGFLFCGDLFTLKSDCEASEICLKNTAARIELAQFKLQNRGEMNALRPLRRSKSADTTLLVALLLGSSLMGSSVPVCANAAGTNELTEKIECITPDGRLTPISNSDPRNPGRASVSGQDTISCSLQEGKTTFIIPFPKGALLDQFTFINQNPAACGEFNIAVSNSRLSAESPQWIEVDGIVPFAHKRLFNLSMIGIDAKYVKLSFRVEKNSRIARAERRHHEKQPSGADIKLALVAPPAAGPGEQ
jgi:hypothetical protein